MNSILFLKGILISFLFFASLLYFLKMFSSSRVLFFLTFLFYGEFRNFAPIFLAVMQDSILFSFFLVTFSPETLRAIFLWFLHQKVRARKSIIGTKFGNFFLHEKKNLFTVSLT